jgi:hypothetical protein
VGLTSCGRDTPTAPILHGQASLAGRASQAAAPQGAFFPLAIGNHWHSVGDDRVVLTDAGGGVDNFTIHNDITRELIGTEALFGRTYTVMKETTIQTMSFEPEPWITTQWIRYRQDASGLYEADVSGPPASEPVMPSAATELDGVRTPSVRPLPDGMRAKIRPDQIDAYERAWNRLQWKAEALNRHMISDGAARISGVLPNEITRLVYPLRPGEEWTIRTDFFFGSVVEGIEDLDLPAGRFPAYRIRIPNEALGPEDVVHLWMGRSGQLRFRYHLEAPATDQDGNVIGSSSFDHDEVLDQISLVKPSSLTP